MLIFLFVSPQKIYNSQAVEYEEDNILMYFLWPLVLMFCVSLCLHILKLMTNKSSNKKRTYYGYCLSPSREDPDTMSFEWIWRQLLHRKIIKDFENGANFFKLCWIFFEGNIILNSFKNGSIEDQMKPFETQDHKLNGESMQLVYNYIYRFSYPFKIYKNARHQTTVAVFVFSAFKE